MPRTTNRASGGLQHQRHRDGHDHADGFHSDGPPDASRAGVGVSTTSTSSSAREVDRRLDQDPLVGAADPLDRLDASDDESLRDRSRRSPTSSRRRPRRCRPLPTRSPAAAGRRRRRPPRPARAMRSIIAPAAALRSMSSCTFADAQAGHDQPADHAGRRNHRHVRRGPRRACRCRWSASGSPGSPPAPMISAATVLSWRCSRSSEQPLQAAGAIGERALLLQRDLRARQLALQRVVLDLEMAQADVAAPQVANAGDAAGQRRAALPRRRRTSPLRSPARQIRS